MADHGSSSIKKSRGETPLAYPPARSLSRALGIDLGNEADHRPLLLPTVCWLARLITLRDLPLPRHGTTPELCRSSDDRSNVENSPFRFAAQGWQAVPIDRPHSGIRPARPRELRLFSGGSAPGKMAPRVLCLWIGFPHGSFRRSARTGADGVRPIQKLDGPR